MKKVLLILIMMSFNSLAHKLPEAVKVIVDKAQQIDASFERGEKLYKNKCSICHGSSGVPTNNSQTHFPYLRSQTPKYLLIQMAMFKTKHRVNSSMNYIAEDLSAKDMADIKMYLVAPEGSCDQKIIDQSDRVRAGQMLAAKEREFSRADGSTVAISCTMCHGENGLMPDESREHTMHPDLAGLGQKYLLKQFRDFKAKRRVNAGPMNLMVKDLTSEDFLNLSAYYSSLQRCK